MKKALSLILALCMVLTLVFALASCGETPTESAKTTPEQTVGTTKGSTETTATTESKSTSATTAAGSSSSKATAASTASTTAGTASTSDSTGATEELSGYEKHPDFMDVNFGGKTFTFVTEAEATGWEVYEFYAEATGDDDLVAEGVMQRNAIVEQLYNCKIAEYKVAGAAGVIANDIAMGQFNYDYCLYEYSALNYSSSWVNIASMDIDLSNSWWDQAFVDTFCIPVDGVNKMYTIAGKCNVRMMDAIWALFFNKRLYDQLVSSGKIDVDIYEEVKKGTWTMDMMLSMMEAAAKDANGDQTFRYENGDIMGCVTNSNLYMLAAIFYCTGFKAVTKNAEGLPTSMSADNTDISALSAAVDKGIELWQSPYLQAVKRDDVVSGMTNGQSLFASEVLGTVISVTDENAYYSVVPFPKLNESQENYAQYVCNRAYGMKVPTSTKDLNVSAKFLEVFAFHSEKILYPAYIRYYTSQCFCDETAAEMLQIVIDTRVYDLDVFANYGLSSQITNMFTTGNNKVSRMIAKTSASVNTQIDTYLTNLRAAQ